MREEMATTTPVLSLPHDDPAAYVVQCVAGQSAHDSGASAYNDHGVSQ